MSAVPATVVPRTELLTCANEGAKIVTLGVQKLDPGQKVRVVSSLSF